MATVLDTSGNSPIVGVENKLTSPSARLTASPVSSRTPSFVGEIVVDTTNGNTWRAFGSANTQWEHINRE